LATGDLVGLKVTRGRGDMRELGGPRTVDHPVKHADQGFERFGIPNTREVHGRRRVGQSLLPRASIKRIERPKKGEAMSCAANAGKLLIDPTLSQMPPDVAMPKMLAGRVDLVHHPPSALFPGATGACRLLKQRILTGNCGRVTVRTGATTQSRGRWRPQPGGGLSRQLPRRRESLTPTLDRQGIGSYRAPNTCRARQYSCSISSLGGWRPGPRRLPERGAMHCWRRS
jgi:hypothetical protein